MHENLVTPNVQPEDPIPLTTEMGTVESYAQHLATMSGLADQLVTSVQTGDTSLGFAARNGITDAYEAAIKGLGEEDVRGFVGLAVAGFASRVLPALKEQGQSRNHLDIAINDMISRSLWRIDKKSDVDTLTTLTQLAVESDSTHLGELAEAVFASDLYNEVAGMTGPGVFYDPRFRNALIGSRVRRHTAEHALDGPAEMFADEGNGVVEAIRFDLLSMGFASNEARPIIEAWGSMSAGDEPDPQKSMELLEDVHSSRVRMHEIESRSPGLAQRLYRERGVAHFGRYSIDLLMSQFPDREHGRGSDFMVMPHGDHNGAFYYTVRQFEKSLTPQDTWPQIIEADTVDEVVTGTSLLTGQYGATPNLIIGGHGAKDSVNFGAGRLRARSNGDLIVYAGTGTLNIDEVSDKLNHMVQFVRPDSHVVLVSCSTGAEGAIGHKIADFLSATVIAPRTPSNLKHMRRLPNGALVAEYYSDSTETIQPESKVHAAA